MVSEAASSMNSQRIPMMKSASIEYFTMVLALQFLLFTLEYSRAILANIVHIIRPPREWPIMSPFSYTL